VDSFEWNKIAGWALAAGIAVLGLSIVTGAAFPHKRPDKMGYIVQGVEVEDTGGAEKEAEKPISFFLADASVAKGESQFKKCAACHTINKGGHANQGPNLYGIVGNKVAHSPTFNYSDAVKSHGGTWGFDELSHWLESPRKYIPGTKMSFAGISRPEDRADLLVYLNSMSDNPLPLPTPPVAEAPAGTGPESAKAETVATPTAAQAVAQPEKMTGGPAAEQKGKDETDSNQ
jgi:cytochrome c